MVAAAAGYGPVRRIRPCWFLFLSVFWCLPLIALPGPSGWLRAADFTDQILPILQNQCLDCHDARSRKGGLDLERFRTMQDVLTDRAAWKAVFDLVESGQMPLRDSGYELSDEERRAVLEFVESLQARPDPALGVADPGKPVLRRLTRLEYNNTVRDLFGLEIDIFMFPERLPVADKRYFLDGSPSLGAALVTSMREYGQKYDVLLPQQGLPGDNRAEHGFANRGDSLNMSPLLLEKYLEVAHAIAHSERLDQQSPVMGRLLGRASPVPTTPSRPSGQPSGLAGKPGLATDNSVPATGTFAANANVGQHAERNEVGKTSFTAELTEAFEHGSGGVFDVPASLNNRTIAGKTGLIRVRVGDGGEQLTIHPDVDLWLAAFNTAQETSGDHLLTNRNKGQKQFELKFGFEFAGAENGPGNAARENPRDSRQVGGIRQLGVCVLARRGQQGPVVLTAVLSDGTQVSRQATITPETGNVFYSFTAPPRTTIQRLRVDGSRFSGDYVLLDDLGFILTTAQREASAAGLPNPLPSAPAPQPSTTEATGGQSTGGQTTGGQSTGGETASGGQAAVAPLAERFQEFLGRAFRRPVTAAEVSPYLAIVAAAREAGRDERDGIRAAVQAVLASPEFLFIREPLEPEAGLVRPLNDFELATRLSYFVWSSMPDEPLQQVAREGRLRDSGVLREQLARMLADRRRSRELSESFAVQWLRLDQLYTSKPDRERFPAFYSGPQGKSTLHAPMMIEALLLFETVLVEDRSVLELIDADYTWLNPQLATLYGLEAACGQAREQARSQGLVPAEIDPKQAGRFWFRTPLPDRDRGGVMTMAGPLTLTSLPYRTSPIKRGAWLLETLFNRPPAEPRVAFVLDDKPSDSADGGPSLSIRQRFEKHRSDPNCYSCHARIDPPGFSLEAFDAIGAFRTRDGDQPVDASGVWNGREFRGAGQFKTALRERDKEFVRGFVEHLLSYALGRRLEHYDMPVVSSLVRQAEAGEYRFSAILAGVVESYPFLHTRNTGQD